MAVVPALALFSVGLALAWWVISNGMSAALADTRPNAALSWNARNAKALATRADRRLSAGDLDAAESAARRALVLAPLDIDSMTTMAAVAAARGDEARGVKIMLFSGLRSWRHRTSQLWIMQYALNRRDYELAFDQADAMLRRTGGPSAAVINSVITALGDPTAIEVIVPHLERDPRWRASFLISVGAEAPMSTALGLFQRLAKSAAPATPQELGPFLDRVFMREGGRRAHRVWQAVSPHAPPSPETIVNGDFEASEASPPFDWIYGQAAGLTVSRSPAPEGAGHSLRVEYDGYSASPTIAAQNLAVAPGAYEIRGSMMASVDQGDSRLFLTVTCSRTGELLASQPIIPGDGTRWARFRMPVVVQEACDGETLALVGRAGDRRVSALVFIDDLALVRTPQGDSFAVRQ